MPRQLLALGLLLASAFAWAGSPTAFPESAVHVRLGFEDEFVAVVGGDLVLPARYLDFLVGGEVVADLSGLRAGRLSATALIFPTVGTTPPFSLGVAGDVTVRRQSTSVHVGLVSGIDLLYVSRDLPAVIDAYVGPGLTLDGAFSLAWSLEARWYDKDVAWFASTSDVAPFAVGLRFLF